MKWGIPTIAVAIFLALIPCNDGSRRAAPTTLFTSSYVPGTIFQHKLQMLSNRNPTRKFPYQLAISYQVTCQLPDFNHHMLGPIAVKLMAPFKQRPARCRDSWPLVRVPFFASFRRRHISNENKTLRRLYPSIPSTQLVLYCLQSTPTWYSAKMPTMWLSDSQSAWEQAPRTPLRLFQLAHARDF